MNPFYKLLETFDKLEEGNTQVQNMGNKVKVTDEQGDVIEYDKDTWDEMNQQDESIESDEQLDEILPALAGIAARGVAGLGKMAAGAAGRKAVKGMFGDDDEIDEAGYDSKEDRRNWEAGERNDRNFRNQERNAGLEDEDYTWNQQSWEVCFNGKPWKSFKGKQAAQNVGKSMANKGKTGISIRPSKKSKDVTESFSEYNDLTYNFNEDDDWIDEPNENELETGIDSGGWDGANESIEETNYDDDREANGTVVFGKDYGENNDLASYKHGADIDIDLEEADFDPGMSSGHPGDIGDYSAGDNEFDDYEGSEDTPDYEQFELKVHGRRLRPGTPITFASDIGGGEGVFIEKSPSGAFGTAERNGKTISIHLNDIETADLQNAGIYEDFSNHFDQIMEEVTVVRTNNAEDPQNDTITITGTGEHTETLTAIMKLAGMEGGDGVELPQDAEIPVNIDPNMDPEMGQGMGMQDMMGMIDTAERPPISGAEEMESIREEENDDAKPYKNYKKDEENDHYDKKTGKWSRSDDDDEEQVDEGIGDAMKKGGKWLKRGMQGWDMDYADPKDMQQKHNEYDSETLNRLDSNHNNMKGGKDRELGHSPHDFQQKLINRELRRRGERDFKKYGDSRKMTDDVEEDYSNEPDERMADVDAQVNGMSGGLNKRKKMYKKGYPGDNDMTANLEETVNTESKAGFMNLYKKINDINNAG